MCIYIYVFRALLQAVSRQQFLECKVQRVDIAKIRIKVGTLVLLDVIAIASDKTSGTCLLRTWSLVMPDEI